MVGVRFGRYYFGCGPFGDCFRVSHQESKAGQSESQGIAAAERVAIAITPNREDTMSFNWHFYLSFVGLMLAIAYACWRTLRISLYQNDVLNLRTYLINWADRDDKESDPLFMCLDRLLYFAAERTDRLSLLDTTVTMLTGIPPNITTLTILLDTVTSYPRPVPDELREVILTFFWRTLRYLLFESISGLLCAISLFAYASWVKTFGRSIPFEDVLKRLTEFVIGPGDKSRGTMNAVVH